MQRKKIAQKKKKFKALQRNFFTFENKGRCYYFTLMEAPGWAHNILTHHRAGYSHLTQHSPLKAQRGTQCVLYRRGSRF